MKSIAKDCCIREVMALGEFSSVFQTLNREPFLEDWREEALREEFEFFNQNGKILGYYQQECCVGIATIIPRKKIHFSLLNAYGKDMYLSDVVLLDETPKGVSDALVCHAKEVAREMGYLNLCLRTSSNSSGRRERLGKPLDDVEILTEIEKIKASREC